MGTDRPSLLQLYATPKMGVLAALGFCGGVPNVLVTTAAVAWAVQSGWSTASVGTLMAMASLPYGIKFLWAPLVDRVHIPFLGSMGRRRSWMMLSLVVLVIPLIVVAVLGLTLLSDPGENALERGLWITAVVTVAVVSATYDIASDAYRADVLSKEELGAGASSFVSAYRLALVVAGAGVLALSSRIGWTGAWIAGAGLIAVGVAGTLLAKEPPRVAQPNQSAFVAPLQSFWQSWGARVLVLAAFVLLFRLPDQVGNSYSLPFLLKHMQFEALALGYVRQALGLAFTVVGAIVGGWLVARVGLMRCLWIFGVLQAATNGGYMALSMAQDAGHLELLPDVFGGGPVRVAWLSSVLIVENLAGGMVAAGFVAFLMSLCDHRYTAAQYSILSAVMALGGSLGIQLTASLPDKIGWTWFFAFTMALGIPGLLLIRFVGAPPPLASLEPCPKR